MIRRIVLSTLTAILGVNAMADEFFLGGTYDFHRKTSIEINGTGKIKTGFKLRAEWLPFEKNSFKMGTGVTHGFDFKQKNSSKKATMGNITSIYGVIKPEWKINDEWKMYNKYRLGLSFNSGRKFERANTYINSSRLKPKLYVGIEAGMEWKNFLLGLTYDVNYISNNSMKHSGKSSQMRQIGIVIGYVFGNGKISKPVSASTISVKTVSGTEKEKISQESSGQNEKSKEINRKAETDYKKWFSFDEEINK
ncbi:MAG: hypothetical protein Q4D53_02085 [Leptotrichiaceae bacterium]|nr:hypothetical protein [Leptotrichiaceae bacterium]